MRYVRGFSLIELMVVISIVGVLASIATAAYSDYVTRARSAELLTQAASHRPDLDAYASEHGRFPDKPDILNPTPLIQRIEFWLPSCDDLWIHVYPTKKFHSNVIPGRHALIYRGVIEEGGITWQCTFHPTFRKMPARFFPASCVEAIPKDVRRRRCGW